MARLAKVPVFDPSNPQEAREMVGAALDLSEEFRIPVILRPIHLKVYGPKPYFPTPLIFWEMEISLIQNLPLFTGNILPWYLKKFPLPTDWAIREH